MIYRRLTTIRGRIEFVMAQKLGGTDTAATMSRESPFSEWMLVRHRRVNRDACAKYLREMRAELRKFMNEATK